MWYPLSSETNNYRRWQRTKPYEFIEVEFMGYKPGKGGWSGQGDMRGAGLTLKGLPPQSIFRGMEVGMILKGIFDGQAASGRNFDLRVTISA